MKLAPTGVGAEPKKLALLFGILILGVVVYWFQNRSGTPVSANVAPPPPIETQPLKPLSQKQVTTEQQAEVASRREDSSNPDPDSIIRRGPLGGGTGNDTFIPSMKHKDDLDISKIDPRIRLDLLAKVRAVPLEGGSSSLFDFSKPPEPPAPKMSPITPQPVPVPPPPKPASTVSKGPPPPPPPPPIPFKYYGYAGTAEDGQLQGLFMEGDAITGSIYPKREGDIIKDRYKIVHIGLKSAIVEDTVTHNQQTLRLLAEQEQ